MNQDEFSGFHLSGFLLDVGIGEVGEVPVAVVAVAALAALMREPLELRPSAENNDDRLTPMASQMSSHVCPFSRAASISGFMALIRSACVVGVRGFSISVLSLCSASFFISAIPSHRFVAPGTCFVAR